MIPFETPESLPGKHLETYEQALKLGENYEEIVAQQITDLGLPCYRLKQRFLTSDQLWENRFRRLRGRPERHTKDNPGLLRPYQVDLAIALGKYRRALVEVKALSSQAFSRDWIHVGDVRKFDQKVLPVAALMLINRVTREAWAIAYEPETWSRKKSIWDPSRMDYVIHRSALSPLEAFVDALKDGLTDVR
ncbi:hypothetical protein [Leptolyngbya iicbica]|uniref:Uncharacterized protein n=2 Tax=Cyanophyceae TaxID=3028117 RepID=A0A4V2E2S0_9CYAN|nr:hypothetical protein [Leptolyngbya sp. LK]RZM79526.1 hypothetical protein DYY88_12460 [Leptolyngbya sp. LK]